MKNKKKVYISGFILLGMFIVLFVCGSSAISGCTSEVEATTDAATLPTTEPTESTISLIDEPVLYDDLFCYEFDSVERAELFINAVETATNTLLAECATEDKYTAEAITLMLEELDRLVAEQTHAIRQKEYLLKWAEKEEEYYYATRTWKYLKSLGYSDVACAGILGNLMAECGGHTLKLDPFLYDRATGKYYGMFQWSIRYYPEAEGLSFEEQLDYYAKTSPMIFKIWGNKYKNGFTLDDFNKLDDPRDAALAFAKIYERCASWTYERRQNFSEVAYKYFVLDFEEI